MTGVDIHWRVSATRRSRHRIDISSDAGLPGGDYARFVSSDAASWPNQISVKRYLPSLTLCPAQARSAAFCAIFWHFTSVHRPGVTLTHLQLRSAGEKWKNVRLPERNPLLVINLSDAGNA